MCDCEDYCDCEHLESVKDMVGKTIIEIIGNEIKSEDIIFLCSDGSKYKMYHVQDCCEHVMVDNIVGDFKNIINEKITEINESNPDREVKGIEDDFVLESFTWYDFEIKTLKGSVVFQWLGCSNGCYSEVPKLIKVSE